MNPRISIFVAVAQNGVIGKNNSLPWYIPEDLKRFKALTIPHPIIMGRKNHESIGRVLPNRPNIIITRDPNFRVQGAIIAHSLEEAIAKAKELDQGEIFITGGGQVYQEAFPLVERLYLTKIHKDIDGDIFFPDYSKFQKVLSQEDRESGDLKFTYYILEK
jgi:dihydrofolate reductase